MHFRRIDRDNAAARLYEFVTRHPGQEISGPELARAAAKDPAWPLTAVGTCVCEVRQQLTPRESLRCIQRGGRFYYVYEAQATGQMVLC